MGRLITINETARRFGLTEQTIKNWIANGHINVRRVGKACYIDEKTVDALQDTAEDIRLAREALERMLCEDRQKLSYKENDSAERKIRSRYLELAAGVGLRSGFYDVMCHLLVSMGCISEREGTVLSDFLNGKSLNEIGERQGVTRERVRQLIEKAIRKSRELMVIEEKLRRLSFLEKENEDIKRQNRLLVDHLRQYERLEAATDEEKKNNEVLYDLLNTRLVDCGLSVRSLNSLWVGRTDKKFSFGEIVEEVVVPECRTIGDVCRLTPSQFLKIRNAGTKTLAEVTDFLHSKGLDWGMDVDKVYKDNMVYKCAGIRTK